MGREAIGLLQRILDAQTREDTDRIFSLLTLLVFLFISFLFRGQNAVAAPQSAYEAMPFLQGFNEGYQTMDTIAALNFGLVIATTLGAFGLKEKKDTVRHTVLAGVFAGAILAAVYLMLTYMGMCSSGVYEIQENGAWTLRCIVSQVFGLPGAILLAAIFTLACLTTCTGLINSISQYFSTLFPKISYRKWVVTIVVFSFLICNLGLNAILSISIPVLNAIYPVSIVLIVLGLSHGLWKGNRFVYPVTIGATAVISVLYAVDAAGLSLGVVSRTLRQLPLYDLGFSWVVLSLAALVVSLLLGRLFGKRPCPCGK